MTLRFHHLISLIMGTSILCFPAFARAQGEQDPSPSWFSWFQTWVQYGDLDTPAANWLALRAVLKLLLLLSPFFLTPLLFFFLSSLVATISSAIEQAGATFRQEAIQGNTATIGGRVSAFLSGTISSQGQASTSHSEQPSLSEKTTSPTPQYRPFLSPLPQKGILPSAPTTAQTTASPAHSRQQFSQLIRSLGEKGSPGEQFTQLLEESGLSPEALAGLLSNETHPKQFIRQAATALGATQQDLVQLMLEQGQREGLAHFDLGVLAALPSRQFEFLQERAARFAEAFHEQQRLATAAGEENLKGVYQAAERVFTRFGGRTATQALLSEGKQGHELFAAFHEELGKKSYIPDALDAKRRAILRRDDQQPLTLVDYVQSSARLIERSLQSKDSTQPVKFSPGLAALLALDATENTAISSKQGSVETGFNPVPTTVSPTDSSINVQPKRAILPEFSWIFSPIAEVRAQGQAQELFTSLDSLGKTESLQHFSTTLAPHILSALTDKSGEEPPQQNALTQKSGEEPSQHSIITEIAQRLHSMSQDALIEQQGNQLGMKMNSQRIHALSKDLLPNASPFERIVAGMALEEVQRQTDQMKTTHQLQEGEKGALVPLETSDIFNALQQQYATYAAQSTQSSEAALWEERGHQALLSTAGTLVPNLFSAEKQKDLVQAIQSMPQVITAQAGQFLKQGGHEEELLFLLRALAQQQGREGEKNSSPQEQLSPWLLELFRYRIENAAAQKKRQPQASESKSPVPMQKPNVSPSILDIILENMETLAREAGLQVEQLWKQGKTALSTTGEAFAGESLFSLVWERARNAFARLTPDEQAQVQKELTP